MKIRVYNNVCDILAYDFNEKVFKLKYVEEDEKYEAKYLKQGSMVLWEEEPPKCSKCEKTNKECSLECYNFKTLPKMKDIVQQHNSKRNKKNDIIKAEIKKIEDMKKEGIEYKSWLYTSLFESEDNTERMEFN